jgi:hypothetical protein
MLTRKGKIVLGLRIAAAMPSVLVLLWAAVVMATGDTAASSSLDGPPTTILGWIGYVLLFATVFVGQTFAMVGPDPRDVY